MSETSNDLVMAQLEDVDKEFELRHTRSIKEYVVWWVTGRKGDLSRDLQGTRRGVAVHPSG